MSNKAQRTVELEQSLAEAKYDIQSLQEEVQNYKQTVAAFPQVKADYDDKVAKLQESHKKELEAMKNLLKATETSVNKRVIESLASIGVAQFATEEILSVQGAGPCDLYQKFLSLKGVEQTEFFKKHEQAISKFVHAK